MASLLFTGSAFGQLIKPPATPKEKLGRFEIIGNTILTVDDDFKEIVTRPFKNPNLVDNSFKFFALITTDHLSTRLFQQNIEPIDDYLNPYYGYLPNLTQYWPRAARPWVASSAYMYTGVTGMYVLGFALGNEKMQEAGALTTKAVIESYIVSHVVLKTVFSRHRPVRPLGVIENDRDSQYPFVESPLDFFNFRPPVLASSAYGTGMPSYHSTMYFAFASTMARVYDNYWIPYTLASAGILYHVKGHNHWVSEMVAGMVIGNFIGKVVYENYHDRRDGLLAGKKQSAVKMNWGIGNAFGHTVPSLTLSF